MYLRLAFRNMSAFLTQPTNIEDKRAQISRNWAKVKGVQTRGDISHTVWDVCCEPLVPFHIHQSTRSPKLTTERHSATLTCILAPDPWVCREASELPLVAPVNAEPHKTYVSSLLLLWRVFRDSTAHGPSPASCSEASVPPVHSAHLVFRCLHLSKDPNWSSCVHPETHLATRDWRHLCRSPLFAVHLAHQKICRCTGLVFHSGAPRGFAKNSSNCAMVVYNPSASLGLQNRDRKPQVHDSTAPACSLLEAAVHIANILKLLNNQRWLSFCRASNSKGGLLQHVMSELTLFLVCSRFAVFLTAHASPAHS